MTCADGMDSLKAEVCRPQPPQGERLGTTPTRFAGIADKGKLNTDRACQFWWMVGRFTLRGISADGGVTVRPCSG
jgi:hypothetical protein